MTHPNEASTPSPHFRRKGRPVITQVRDDRDAAQIITRTCSSKETAR